VVKTKLCDVLKRTSTLKRKERKEWQLRHGKDSIAWSGMI